MRRTNRSAAAFLAAALSLLAACEPVDTPSMGFGDSVRQNMQAQIINPLPPDAAAPSDYDGSRVGAAMQRYHDGKVYKPYTPTTSWTGAATAPQQ